MVGIGSRSDEMLLVARSTSQGFSIVHERMMNISNIEFVDA